MIEIVVNGERREVAELTTVAGLLDSLSIPRDRVAVELDRSILKPQFWEATTLHTGARIEIVHFVGGGSI